MTWADERTTFRSLYADSLRLIIDGVDVTVFRGAPSQYESFQLQEPFAYGPAVFAFPQISELEHRSDPALQPADLKWLRKNARAVLVPVTDGNVGTPLWRGFISAPQVTGGTITVTCPGEPTGIFALSDRQPRVFRTRNDIGAFVAQQFREHGLIFRPIDGPNTGIEVDARGSGEPTLDYLSGLLADAQNLDGTAWTVTRATDDRAYEMVLKDTTTVHATIFAGTDGIELDLIDDMSEQPNTFYGSGIHPTDGHKWMNAVIPGVQSDEDPPPYPISGGGSFGEGTTDADTVNGDGITIMQTKLAYTGFLDRDDTADGPIYDEETSAAVRDLQERAGLNTTGNMNQNTWEALFDVTATGYSLDGATVLPLVQSDNVRRWNRTAVGNLSGRNPLLDPSAIVVARTVQHGLLKKSRARTWSRRELARLAGKNWVGTVTLDNVDLFTGNHVHGDPEVLLSRFNLRQGENVMIRGFDGDTLVHVAGITHTGDGRATLMVDTQARDVRTVSEIVNRNRESRRNRSREFRNQLRSTGVVRDSHIGWFEQGGRLGEDLNAPANKWRVFPVVAGQEGTVARMRVKVDEAPFYLAVFAEKVTAKWLNTHIPNPGAQDTDGNYEWATNNQIRKLRNRRSLLAVFGTEDEPCGYGDKRHTNDAGTTTDAPVTGVFETDSSFEYRCLDGPLLWVAVHPLETGTIKRGRIMWQHIAEGS